MGVERKTAKDLGTNVDKVTAQAPGSETKMKKDAEGVT